MFPPGARHSVIGESESVVAGPVPVKGCRGEAYRWNSKAEQDAQPKKADLDGLKGSAHEKVYRRAILACVPWRDPASTLAAQ